MNRGEMREETLDLIRAAAGPAFTNARVHRALNRKAALIHAELCRNSDTNFARGVAVLTLAGATAALPADFEHARLLRRVAQTEPADLDTGLYARLIVEDDRHEERYECGRDADGRPVAFVRYDGVTDACTLEFLRPVGGDWELIYERRFVPIPVADESENNLMTYSTLPPNWRLLAIYESAIELLGANLESERAANIVADRDALRVQLRTGINRTSVR